MDNLSSSIVQEVRQTEVKVLMEVMKTLDPNPGEDPDSSEIFNISKDSMLSHGLIEKVNDKIGITLRGQVLLSIIMARTNSVSDFVMSLGMSAQDTTETITDLQNHTNIETVMDRLIGHVGSGQPGLLVNIFSFLVHRSIVIANELDGFDSFESDDDDTVH